MCVCVCVCVCVCIDNFVYSIYAEGMVNIGFRIYINIFFSHA